MTFISASDETGCITGKIHNAFQMVASFLFHFNGQLPHVVLQTNWLWSINLVSQFMAWQTYRLLNFTPIHEVVWVECHIFTLKLMCCIVDEMIQHFFLLVERVDILDLALANIFEKISWLTLILAILATIQTRGDLSHIFGSGFGRERAFWRRVSCLVLGLWDWWYRLGIISLILWLLWHHGIAALPVNSLCERVSFDRGRLLRRIPILSHKNTVLYCFRHYLLLIGSPRGAEIRFHLVLDIEWYGITRLF